MRGISSASSAGSSCCGSPGRRPAPNPTTRRSVRPRRGGLAGAYLSILGLTLTNPMTILSFGALFAGLGVTSGEPGGAALVTLGVLLGSGAWWVLLTSVVSVLRTRITTVWVRRINVASGLAIGAFALFALGTAMLPVSL